MGGEERGTGRGVRVPLSDALDHAKDSQVYEIWFLYERANTDIAQRRLRKPNG